MNNTEVNFSKDIDITNLDKHIELINSHMDMFSDDFKDALGNLVKCGSEVCKLYVHTIEDMEFNRILSLIDIHTTITMAVRGNTNNYIPAIDGYGSWDLKCLNDEEHENAYYGIDAVSIEQLREILKEDFKSGIISMISVGGQTIGNNVTNIKHN